MINTFYEDIQNSTLKLNQFDLLVQEMLIHQLKSLGHLPGLPCCKRIYDSQWSLLIACQHEDCEYKIIIDRHNGQTMNDSEYFEFSIWVMNANGPYEYIGVHRYPHKNNKPIKIENKAYCSRLSVMT